MPAMIDIVGRDLQDATAMLEEAGIIDLSQIGYFGTWPISVEWETDPSAEPNTVLTQNPGVYGDVSGYTELFDVMTASSLNSTLLSNSGHGAPSTCALTASATGWGLVGTSTGVTPPAFAFASEAPLPSGYGFYASASPSGPFVSANYYSVDASAMSLYIGVENCDVTADLYVRFWKYDTVAQTFTALGQLQALGTTLPNETRVTVSTWSAIINNVLYFDSTDALFIDVVANITANSPVASGPVISLGLSAGSGMLVMSVAKYGPNIVKVNSGINLEVANLPVSVIYP